MVRLPRIEKIGSRLDCNDWIKNYAKRHKLVKIGAGAFATAFSSSKEKGRVVVKIGICDEHIRNDPYVDFLRTVALKHQNNPFVPKIRSVRFILLTTIEEGDEYYPSYEAERCYLYIVKMERLTHFKKIGNSSFRDRLLWKHGLMDIEDLNEPYDVAKRDMTGRFQKIAKDFNKLLCNHDEDIHDGNLMWRGRGANAQLVITDPVA